MAVVQPESSLGRKFGEVTFKERLHILVTFFRLAIILAWNLIYKRYFTRRGSDERHWKRVVSDTIIQVMLAGLNRVQLQYILGSSSLRVYERWVEGAELPFVIEEIGEDARLMWIGPKRTDKVILYFHGGGFLLPVQTPSLWFWKYTQDKFKTRGLDVGFAVLDYTLVPNSIFPAQLKQACKAVKHILDSGVLPRNLQLVGDSAGANLILQVFSHILHPVDGVPAFKIFDSIRGAYLMSPWVRLGSAADEINAFPSMGHDVLHGVPDAQNVHLEGIQASDDWFKGIHRVVSRVLITAGGNEMLKDEIMKTFKLFKLHYVNTELVVQEDGLHNDPFYDFFFGEDESIHKGVITPLVIQWLASGFVKQLSDSW
ncbi:alpha/beta-hydrolase [Pluteus cervinus]|uniref:Alpha/beta-hydrolase n=1 Tax=Pluteus cervinus TaxID=181527 RepID=A0ACD3A5Y2_9AGAR|nr:alpha/beta-hydrolase [Pluteus cervinus]